MLPTSHLKPRIAGGLDVVSNTQGQYFHSRGFIAKSPGIAVSDNGNTPRLLLVFAILALRLGAARQRFRRKSRLNFRSGPRLAPATRRVLPLLFLAALRSRFHRGDAGDAQKCVSRPRRATGQRLPTSHSSVEKNTVSLYKVCQRHFFFTLSSGQPLLGDPLPGQPANGAWNRQHDNSLSPLTFANSSDGQALGVGPLLRASPAAAANGSMRMRNVRNVVSTAQLTQLWTGNVCSCFCHLARPNACRACTIFARQPEWRG